MQPARSLAETRGDSTKARVLDTAIDVFATLGYEGASTRHLAAAAGVNQPAIQYHFASKEGLYRAAVERIATDIETKVGPAAAAITAALKDPGQESGGDQVVETALLELLDAMADMVLSRDEKDSHGLFITRAELENSCMLEPLARVLTKCLFHPAAAALARLTGREDGQDSNLRALALLGQTLNFKNKCLGDAVRRGLGLGEFDEPMKMTVKAIIRENTLAIIAGTRRETPA